MNPVRVYVDPIPGDMVSRAMWRVAHALRRYAPPEVKIVNTLGEAPEIQVMHVIGPYPDSKLQAPTSVAIQYCYNTSPARDSYLDLWKRAKLVWSYYDLGHLVPAGRFYHAPLGVDGSVFHPNGSARYIGALTSGFVAGPGAEAIEEVADAALGTGLSVFHLGPAAPENMKPRSESSWRSGMGMDDQELAGIYGKTRWVSGLRHVEGFEFPVIEGLACGARPFVFDRPETRHWYGGHVEYLDETSGAGLVHQLLNLMAFDPRPVSQEERQAVLEKFNWERIVDGFWKRVLR